MHFVPGNSLSPGTAQVLVLGDSLALGTAQALRWPRRAAVGAPSTRILGWVPENNFDVVVISAGTNDPPGPACHLIREKVKAQHVIWILPVNRARDTVDALATEYGDDVVTYRPLPRGRGWPHPPSYVPLAQEVLRLVGASHVQTAV